MEAPVYGITKPLGSWNPVWANLHVFVEIARRVRRVTRWTDRQRSVFGRPGWSPAELGESDRLRPVTPESYHKFDPPVAQVLAGVFYLILALSNVAACSWPRAAAPPLC